MELTLTGPQQAGIGEEFTVVLEANVYEPVTALPVVVRFDPLALQLMEARPDELAQASGITQITPRLNSLTGRLDLDLRAAADKPFSRSGKLVALRFKTRLPRTQTSIAVAQIDLKDGGTTRTIAKPQPLLLRLGQ
jgi:hypothetical protein